MTTYGRGKGWVKSRRGMVLPILVVSLVAMVGFLRWRSTWGCSQWPRSRRSRRPTSPAGRRAQRQRRPDQQLQSDRGHHQRAKRPELQQRPWSDHQLVSAKSDLWHVRLQPDHPGLQRHLPGNVWPGRHRGCGHHHVERPSSGVQHDLWNSTASQRFGHRSGLRIGPATSPW